MTPAPMVALVLGLSAAATGQTLLFRAGDFSLSLGGAFTEAVRFEDAEVSAIHAEAGYYIFDNFSLSVRLGGLRISQIGEDATAFNAEVVARWHMLRLGPCTVYADVGGGRLWADHATRSGGTTYNCTARVGPGLTVRLADGVHLMGGVRWLHYSNGNEHGIDRNKAFDGVEYYAGLLITLGSR